VGLLRIILNSCTNKTTATNSLRQTQFVPNERSIAMRSKPPLSVRRIVGEILAGGVGGVVVGVASFYATFALDLPGGKCNPAVVYVAGIGLTLGSSIGVYVVGNIGNETGSFLATLGGNILLFFGASIILTEYGSDLGDNYIVNIAILLCYIAVAPPLFATIAFNLTRKYKSGYENEPH